jgi:DNA-binding GntR family transcriptional regulator
MARSTRSPGGPALDFPVGEMTPISRDSLANMAYWKIRNALKRSHFRPSQKLVLRNVAAELGISLTPLREAFARLISENALAVDARGVVHVPDLDLAQYREIRDIRIELESRAAVAAAVRVTPKDIAILRAFQDQFLASNAKDRALIGLEANEKFHFYLYGLAEMPVLYSIIEGLWMRCGPIFLRLREGQRSTLNDQHSMIIEGLEKRDLEMVRQGVTGDIMNGWAVLSAGWETTGPIADAAIPVQALFPGAE